jgi:hypothetical protein
MVPSIPSLLGLNDISIQCCHHAALQSIGSRAGGKSRAVSATACQGLGGGRLIASFIVLIKFVPLINNMKSEACYVLVTGLNPRKTCVHELLSR